MKTGINGLSVMRSRYVLCGQNAREMRNARWIWDIIHIIRSILAQICCNKNTLHYTVWANLGACQRRPVYCPWHKMVCGITNTPPAERGHCKRKDTLPQHQLHIKTQLLSSIPAAANQTTAGNTAATGRPWELGISHVSDLKYGKVKVLT